jgi:nitrate reductase assembly molybdenum cofactor insertion protein NarJ
MTTTLNPSQESRRAMADALNWRLIGLLLERPRSGWIEEAETLAAETRDRQLRDAVRVARGATEGAYLSLFAEGGFVSPRETTWRHREDPGQILADIAGFYQAFAFRPRVEDPLDHIAVEAGFIGYLCLKEARALAHDDAESAETTASARRRFIADHLGHFAEEWADRVSATGVPHLSAAAQALAERRIGQLDHVAEEASPKNKGESK